MQCEYCDKILISLSSLKNHQKTVKYCLAKQNKELIKEHICCFCDTAFAVKSSLNNHLRICKSNTPLMQEKIQLLDEKSIELNDYKQKFVEKDMIIAEKDRIIAEKDRIIEEQKIIIKEFHGEQRSQIKDLQDRMQCMLEKAIDKPSSSTINQNTTNQIINSWQTIVEIEQETDTTEQPTDEPYELVPLELDNGYIIESRDEDGYIDVTNLCAAGKKKFKAWNRLDKTKAFLKELSLRVLISTVKLIKQNTGGNGERHTWVHPQVAINIAQWISPQFDVKVSAWVLEVMMTGKVDITNTKSYRELKEDNKNKQLKIQLMTKKYVKKQPRVHYDEENVVYILTTSNMKKERRYILGKATNLTSRLSVYNKSDEHEVVYYQECPDEEKMSVVETLVFCKLNDYREQANRERFLLPEGTSIDLFSDTIKDCIAFVK